MLDALDMVVLHHDALECVLSPRIGGSVGRLTWHGADEPVELMRRASSRALRAGSAHDMACYPLLPFSNRIAHGRFRFDGRDVSLPLNQTTYPHAIHGHGWETAWSVDWQEGTAARLSYRHDAGDWPWPYTARQTFVLEPDALAVTLDLLNEGDGPMPAGMGLHPYFPKPPDTRFSARVGSVWLNDETMMPRERVPLPTDWQFPEGVVLDGLVLDNCFAGWDGEAFITWPGDGLGMSITTEGPYGHLIVYAPQGHDFFCAEPVTHMTDAVNRPQEPDAGLCTLPPGERMTSTIRFRVEPL